MNNLQQFMITKVNELLKLDLKIKNNLVRYYKALKRKPINVFTLQEAANLSKSKVNKKQSVDPFGVKHKPPEIKFPNKKSAHKYEDNIIVTYEHLKNDDERFGPVVNELKLRKRKSSLILLEGVRLITEAINQKVKITSLFFTDSNILKKLPCNKIVNLQECKIFKVSEKQMKLWSETKGPSGSLAIARLPTFPNVSSSTSSLLPVTLVIDELNDEGQLGTLLRSAVASRVQRILIVQDSVDPWSAKVLRAGMGAHFHQPIHSTQWENIHSYIKNAAHNIVIREGDDETDRKKSPSSTCNICVLNTFTDETLNKFTKRFNSIEAVDYLDDVKYEPNCFVIISGDKPSKNLINLLETHNDNKITIRIITFPKQNEVHLSQAVCGSVLLYCIMHKLSSQLS